MTKPRVRMAVFCNEIAFDSKDRLCVLGINDGINVLSFPVSIERWLAVSVACEEGPHTMAFRLFDPTGKLVSATDAFPVTANECGLQVTSRMVLDLDVAGAHTVEIRLSGDVIGEIPFEVFPEAPIAPTRHVLG